MKHLAVIRRAAAGLTAAAVVAWAVPSMAATAACVSPYTVARGDTLSLIAERFLGDVLDFRRLHDLNRTAIGPDPAVLEVGTVLTIPCDDDAARAARAEGETATPDAAAPTGDTVAGSSADAPPTTAASALEGRADGLAAAEAPAPGRTRFVTATTLSGIGDSQRPQIVDLRPGPSEALDFIPRATHLPAGWRDAIAETAATRTALDRRLARAGLRVDRPFVLVAADGSDAALGRAAVAAWVLRSAGAGDVSILWGGMAAWRASGRPEWSSPVTPRPRDDARIAAPAREIGTAAWRAALAGEGRGKLVVIGAPGEAPSAPPNAVSAALPDLAAATPEDLALTALSWLKTVPVAWERTPVGLTAREPGHAAIAWLLASEVSEIRDVWLAPPLDALMPPGDEAG